MKVGIGIRIEIIRHHANVFDIFIDNRFKYSFIVKHHIRKISVLRGYFNKDEHAFKDKYFKNSGIKNLLPAIQIVIKREFKKS